MLRRFIDDYHFLADTKTGVTLRWGKTFADNPLFSPIPELADISISNHCSKGCSFCYRNSLVNNEFMSVADYCSVLDAMNHPHYGNVFQVALGGGEPLEHPNFLEIIDETIRRGIIPNFTTNGIKLNPQLCKTLKGKVGAVALSTTTIDELAKDKIYLLTQEGIKINIHYVLASHNIEEATNILYGKFNHLLEGVNAVIFLTYKPAGRANKEGVIKLNDSFNVFLKALKNSEIKRPKIGFDACFVPVLLRNKCVKPELVDVCEGGFFSVYIDHNMNVSPCSFSGEKDKYNLKDYDFYDIWLDKFDSFRINNNNKCKQKDCSSYSLCRGCCPYYPEITICHVD